MNKKTEKYEIFIQPNIIEINNAESKRKPKHLKIAMNFPNYYNPGNKDVTRMLDHLIKQQLGAWDIKVCNLRLSWEEYIDEPELQKEIGK